MNKKLVIAAILVATVAVAGVGAIFLLDEPPGSRTSTTAGAAPERRPTPDPGFDDIPAGATTAGSVALSPEQEKALRAALERIGNESAIRAALFADVPEPWQLPDAQKQFGSCLSTVADGLPANRLAAKEEICACTTRIMQRAFPRTPPVPGNRRGKNAVGSAYRAAVEECTNGP